MLASAGLPANSHTGYELLDSLTGFGTTSQMFDAAYWRAKEGELARTIVASPHLRQARVHISQGVNGAFRRDIAPTASVSVTSQWRATGTGTGAGGAVSCGNRPCQGMTPQDVSIIDSANGVVIGPDDSGQHSGRVGRPGARFATQRESVCLKLMLVRGVPVVEVSLEMVTDRETITERRIDPDTRVAIRSESEETRISSTDSRAQGVTVASNLPDGDAAEGGAAENTETQTRQSTNFEISHTLREIERAPGAIRRMTVAVLIDGVQEPQPRWNAVLAPAQRRGTGPIARACRVCRGL